MPVKDSMFPGMGQSGSTSELHSSSTSWPLNRTTPTSMMRWWAGLPPVVSRSTNTRSCGSPAERFETSAASIEREDGVVKIRPPVAKHSPGLAIAADLVEIESCREHGLGDAIRLRQLLARVGG